jgi:hypothetical protein
MLRSLIGDSGDEVKHGFFYIGKVASNVHSGVERDLIVSASCGVKTLSRITYPCGKLRLNEHMYVLSLGIKGKRSAFNVGKYAAKTLMYKLFVIFGDYALSCQHSGMSHTARDVLTVHSLIERDGGIEIVNLGVKSLFEAALPHFLALHYGKYPFAPCSDICTAILS